MTTSPTRAPAGATNTHVSSRPSTRPTRRASGRSRGRRRPRQRGVFGSSGPTFASGGSSSTSSRATVTPSSWSRSARAAATRGRRGSRASSAPRRNACAPRANSLWRQRFQRDKSVNRMRFDVAVVVFYATRPRPESNTRGACSSRSGLRGSATRRSRTGRAMSRVRLRISWRSERSDASCSSGTWS